MFDLIALLYSNMYSYIDVMSDYILTGGISYMGNFSSTLTQHKIELQLLSNHILLFDCLENVVLVP